MEDLSAVRHQFETATDGIRGVFTHEPGKGMMNAETVEGLTSALVAHPGTQRDGPVVVGMDTRRSGPVLKDAAINGALLGSAEHVYDLGVMPTPAIQKIAEHVGARATVAITASHNPANENGWKGMTGNSKPNDAQIKTLSDMFFDGLADAQGGLATGVVDTQSAAELKQWYIDSVVDRVAAEFGEGILDGKLFVYDGARGAAREMMPRILRGLGASVITYATDKKGLINKNAGAAHLQGLQDYLSSRERYTRRSNFVGALANDGDGDRVMGMGVRTHGDVTDADIINGNHFMWAMAQGQEGLVGTIYTNGGLRLALKEAGIEFIECGNGDRYVTEALQQHGLSRGGEFTGHMVNLDWLGSGDGLMNGAWYAADTVNRDMTFADRLEELKLFPELIKGFRVSSPAKAKQYLNSELYKLDRHVIELGLREAGGRTIVRPSGTEPVVRVWGEADDPELLARTVNELADHIQTELDAA